MDDRVAIALISTGVGSIGLQVVKYIYAYLSKHSDVAQTKLDSAEDELRHVLQAQIRELKAESRRQEEETEYWRGRAEGFAREGNPRLAAAA
jgi:hypothetical protein